MNSVNIQPAPPALLDDSRAPRLGRYLGHVRADWSAAPVGRFRRLLTGKRWQWVGIGTPACYASIAIIDLGWVASAFAYVFDRERRELAADLAWKAPPGASRVSAAAGAGARAEFHGRRVELRIERHERADGARWRVTGDAPGFAIDAELDAAAAPPVLCAIARPPGAFGNCTHKTACLPARGEVTAGTRRWSLDGGTAALDHTSGLLARETRWRWASASRPGLGLNLVEGFNGAVENALWLDGQVIGVGDARIEPDAHDPMRPWSVITSDGVIDLEFTPEGRRAADEDLKIAVSRYVQPIGTFRGSVRPPGGAPLAVRDLLGVTEDHIARW